MGDARIEIVRRQRGGGIGEEGPDVGLGLKDAGNVRDLVGTQVGGVVLQFGQVEESVRKDPSVLLPPALLAAPFVHHGAQRVDERGVITRVELGESAYALLADAVAT